MRLTTQQTVRLVVAGVVLLLEAVGLRQGGTLGLLLVIGLMVVTVFAIAVNFDAGRAGVIVCYAAVFTQTWNGWYVGPFHPGDVLVLVALILFVADNPDKSLQLPPWWVKQLAGVILLVAVIYIFFPVDHDYLVHRTVLSGNGQVTTSTKGGVVVANLGIAFKFIVGVAALPVALTLAVRRHRRAVYWLPVAFAVGTALSGFAAFLGKLGFNQLIAAVTHFPPAAGRQFGFALHPNFLAASLVIAVPFAMWLAFSPDRRSMVIGWCALPWFPLGIYASGSRGGTVGVVIAIVAGVVLLPRARRFAPMLGLLAAIFTGIVFVFLPSLGDQILRATRLSGGYSAAASDFVRNAVAHQALLDLKHSPIWGVGLQVSSEAQNVYLQELASGGLLLFVAMQVYMFAGIATGLRLMRQYHLAAAVVASLIAMLAINYVEADLTDRFYYLPAAIVIALLYHHRRTVAEAAGLDVDDPDSRGQVDEAMAARTG